MVLAVAGQAVPIFWLALMLIWLFAVRLEWLPVFGSGTLAAPGAAGGEPLDDRARPTGPARPLQHARGAGAGLRADRARQGPRRGAGRLAARAQERGHPDRHGGRPAARAAPGRRRRHRDDLRLARHRRPGGRGHLQPRLPGGAGGDAGHLADLRRRQPGRSTSPTWRSIHGSGSDDALVRRGRPCSPPAPSWRSILLLAVFADRVAPAGPNEQNITARLRPPALAGGSWSRPLGTDELGRDVLSRLMYGGRVSLMVGAAGGGGLLPARRRHRAGIAGFFGGCDRSHARCASPTSSSPSRPSCSRWRW